MITDFTPLDFPEDVVGSETELGDFIGAQTTTIGELLEDVDIVVSEAREVSGAGNGGGTTTDEGDLLVVSGRVLTNVGVASLWNSHLLEGVNGEGLEATDVDGTTGGVREVATADAQNFSGTDVTA